MESLFALFALLIGKKTLSLTRIDCQAECHNKGIRMYRVLMASASKSHSCQTE
jgi:hypothetical protein